MNRIGVVEIALHLIADEVVASAEHRERRADHRDHPARAQRGRGSLAAEMPQHEPRDEYRELEHERRMTEKHRHWNLSQVFAT